MPRYGELLDLGHGRFGVASARGFAFKYGFSQLAEARRRRLAAWVCAQRRSAALVSRSAALLAQSSG